VPGTPRSSQCKRGVYASMRFVYVAAAVGMAIAVLFIAPVVLMAASFGHADTGMSGYLRCIQSAGVPPRQPAEDWRPTIRIINGDPSSGESPAEVAQKLAGRGAKPNDAVAEVQCVLANQP
jgi:hypothetical protein